MFWCASECALTLTVYKIVGSKYKISLDPYCIFFPRYLFLHTMTKALLKNIVDEAS